MISEAPHARTTGRPNSTNRITQHEHATAAGPRSSAYGGLISESATPTSDFVAPPSAQAIKERKEAGRQRALALEAEILSSYQDANATNRRRLFTSLVAIQGGASEAADELVRAVITESFCKADPGQWFRAAVLCRLKDHQLWDPQICVWFNKRKKRGNSLQSIFGAVSAPSS